MTSRLHWIFSLVLFSAISLSACSSIEVQQDDPAQLFKLAEEEIKNEHYILATERLKTIRNRFPYSQQAPLAQVRLADVYFLQESFNEAAVAYETFRDLHPKHELVPYALFRTGRSYFRDAPTEIARDLGPASRAVEAYREFLKRFPNHSLSEDAHKELDEALELLARKENYIAQFYRREGQVKAAKARLEFLVATYPETATAKEARKTLQELSAP